MAYKCILLMLTRYVALLTAVSTEHSFVGLCSILLLHRKRTAPTANTVHLLALVCPVSMGPILGFRVNCSFRRRSRQYRQSKNISVLRAPVQWVKECLVYQRFLVQVWLLHIAFASNKNGTHGHVCPVSMGPIVGFWVNCPQVS